MEKKLCLSKANKILAGVCGGFAEYFNLDPTLIRVIWLIVIIMTIPVPLGIIIYVVCWAIMPLKE